MTIHERARQYAITWFSPQRPVENGTVHVRPEPGAGDPAGVFATWRLHHGLRVQWIGEDGQVVIAGHHSDRRSVAAVSKLYRSDVGERLDGSYDLAVRGLSRRWARFLTECERATVDGHSPDCSRCREIKGEDWWLDYRATEPTPGTVPVTTWRPW